MCSDQVRDSPPTAQGAHQQAKYLVGSLPRIVLSRPVPNFRYRDMGALVSLADYDAARCASSACSTDSPSAGGWRSSAPWMLYRSHQARIHGFWRGGLLWLVDRLTSRVRASTRLD